MSKGKGKDYCLVDHSNKQIDRLRDNPNRASLRQATQRRTAASTHPSGAADFGVESTSKVD
jgi:hypothetical protein